MNFLENDNRTRLRPGRIYVLGQTVDSDDGLARPGNKPLSEPMMANLQTQTRITRPQ